MAHGDPAHAISAAIGAHGAWKMRLRTAVGTGSSQITPVQARCDKSCPFGQWLHGPELPSSFKMGTPYQVIKRLHEEFHDSAANVLTHAVAGRTHDAASLLSTEFTARSDKLVRALTKWKGELAS